MVHTIASAGCSGCGWNSAEGGTPIRSGSGSPAIGQRLGELDAEPMDLPIIAARVGRDQIPGPARTRRTRPDLRKRHDVDLAKTS
ncbi:hypothetical protein KIPE111705_44835 [Kibdelosporangium persicum]|uniref:hypothetical protein n=1 Tax=Kibdelosporangium persicum TaxID=2698649 RepID=UPI0039EF74C2